MTVQELEAKVSGMRFDNPELNEDTAYAIACDHYSVEEFLDLKRRLGLEPEELVETIKFIEQRAGLNETEAGNNQKPVDASRTEGRGASDPEQVAEEMEE